ncbi:hypothetical protein KJK34_10100 [Flavobacterium sp. D11R37]|nr:hypothetical protein [Flavobacterium coralii]
MAFILLVSCDTSLKQTLLNQEDSEYWCFYDSLEGYYGIYFKFKKDGLYDRYYIDEDGKVELRNKDGDLYYNREWNLRDNDSVMVLNYNVMDVVSYNENVIVLSNNDKYIFLLKENATNRRKGEKYYHNKRLSNPDVYVK